ncbi:MAG: thioredoxin domain-containing protein [Kofleriaceae bacterium]|nr:thioredoxin domain-containing protein [Myxococcales bacterium]MCB9562373.1 thioredoxin domain-containing protein [Kofleriaceae bacterium]
MKNRSLVTLVVALSVGVTLSACQQDNKAVEKKLDDLSKQVTDLKKMVAAGGGGRGAAPAQRPRRQEPDPKDVYAVPIDGLPFRGAADAPVTIVKAYEFACPYCEKVRPTHDQILKDYDGKVKIVYDDFVVHPQYATMPAQAACAATKQGKFPEMEHALWEKAFKTRKFDEDNMVALATELGLNVDKFKTDMKGDCVAFVQKNQATLRSFGVGATPAHFINGRFLPGGAVPYPQFKAMIDEELKKAEERIAAGTPKADYYKTWVMDKGLKKFTPKAEK